MKSLFKWNERLVKAWGLLPAKPGDILGTELTPQYRIAAKSGYGSFSTVWMARDLVAGTMVAVKLVQALETPTSREAAILEHLSASESSDAPRFSSANGIHQLLEGLAFIDGRGIAHGANCSHSEHVNLYPRNIGVVVPEFDKFSKVDIWCLGGQPDLVPLVTEGLVPAHLTHALNLGKFLLDEVPGFVAREQRVRILDFGCAFFAQDAPCFPCTVPIIYAAPEVFFPRTARGDKHAPWDRRSDVWSFACVMGATALDPKSIPHAALTRRGHLFHDGQEFLNRMARFYDGAPDEWMEYFASVSDAGPPKRVHRLLFYPNLKRGANDCIAYTFKAEDAFWAASAKAFQKAGQSVEDARGVVGLLRRMLVINPTRRPTAAELLLDSYLARRDVSVGPSG
ncbi:kinase-like domain-containing protein [Mycena rosella]|uniref:Kinase-like domain-containing protein n=1 Tax=Mycena rosella TaxID=1033263 RepID=A0AAD7C827_MYCRO|nr:kinase-like domain-containing protein [Mycena rosella]